MYFLYILYSEQTCRNQCVLFAFSKPNKKNQQQKNDAAQFLDACGNEKQVINLEGPSALLHFCYIICNMIVFLCSLLSLDTPLLIIIFFTSNTWF